MYDSACYVQMYDSAISWCWNTKYLSVQLSTGFSVGMRTMHAFAEYSDILTSQRKNIIATMNQCTAMQFYLEYKHWWKCLKLQFNMQMNSITCMRSKKYLKQHACWSSFAGVAIQLPFLSQWRLQPGFGNELNINDASASKVIHWRASIRIRLCYWLEYTLLLGFIN